MPTNLTNLSRIKRNEAIRVFKQYIAGFKNNDDITIFDNNLANIASLLNTGEPIVEFDIPAEKKREIEQGLLGTDGAAFFLKDMLLH